MQVSPDPLSLLVRASPNDSIDGVNFKFNVGEAEDVKVRAGL